ncbi:MAG: OmpA family protein [Nitrospirae bacterium]|nr:OmpA family protein [Nitrospirota bacterium]MDA1305140.1 OmpA family protein [Nitrospirota bacterium]
MERCRTLTTALLVLLSLGVMLPGCSSRLYTSLVSSDDDLSGKLASLEASPSSDGLSVQQSIAKGEDGSGAGLLGQEVMADNSGEQSPSPSPGNSIQGETGHIVSSSPTTSSSEDIMPLEGQDFLTEMAAASGTGGATGNDVGSSASRNKGEGLRPLGNELLGKGSIGDVFFDFDAATLRSDAESTLQVNAQILKASLGDRGVVIEGHCDERGTADYNLVLGERRAQSTKQYLVDLGVSSSTIQTISYGKEKPFCNASQPDCWKQNRRGHFVVE